MIAHKHVWLPTEPQRIQAMAATHLAVLETPVILPPEAGPPSPIIATLEDRRLVVHWWNASGAADAEATWWHYTADVNVHEPEDPHPLLDDLLTQPWSPAIALASTVDRVFVFYRRSASPGAAGIVLDSTGLRIEAVSYAPSPGAELVGVRTRLRFQNTEYVRPGHSLWATYDQRGHRILLLSQAMRREPPNEWKLVLFTGRPRGDEIEWADPLEIGDGGFALDTVRVGRRIVCIFRRAKYALTWWGVDASTFSPEYNPLTLVELNLDAPSDPVVRRMPAIPGGEHPQIQNLAPLWITMERLNVVSPRAPRSQRDRPIRVKHLLQHIDDQWRMGTVAQELDHWVPRHFVDTDAVHPLARQLMSEQVDGSRRGATIQPKWPFYLRHFEYDAAKNTGDLDFLHHGVRSGTLLVSRYHLDAGSDPLDLRITAHAVIDINHEELVRPADIKPPLTLENVPYTPFIVDRNDPEIGVESAPSDAPIFTAQYEVDNTIGGLLVVGSDALASPIVAYTDTADGGCRMVAAALPQPTEPPDAKTFSPAAVTGPALAADSWVELSHGPGEFIEGDLPGNRVEVGPAGAHGVGRISGLLDFLLQVGIGISGSILDGEEEFWLDEPRADGIEADFAMGPLLPPGAASLWDALWELERKVSLPLGGSPQLQYRELRMRLGKHQMTWALSEDGAEDRLTIKKFMVHHTRFRFADAEAAVPRQGHVQYEIPITLDAPEVRLRGLLGAPLDPLVAVNNLKVVIPYRRQFTPCVLMSDAEFGIRDDGSISDGKETTREPDKETPAALSARPVGPARIAREDVQVKVECALTPLGSALTGLLVVLAALGLSVLLALVLTVTVAITNPVGAIVTIALAWALISTIVHFIAPPLLSLAVEGAVRALLPYDDLEITLAEQGIFDMAGEGLAECIARQVLVQVGAQLDVPPFAPLRNRLRPNIWQMIFVSEGKCRVLVRI